MEGGLPVAQVPPRALLVSRGDLAIFVARPISFIFIAMTVDVIAWTLVSALKRSRNKNSAALDPLGQDL